MNQGERIPASPMPSGPVGPVAVPPPADQDELDLGELIGAVRDSRWLVLAVAALVNASGVLYAILATPVYRADALVQVEEKKEALGALKELSSMFTGEAAAEAEIEIIRSRSVLAGVVDQLGLDIEVTPRHFPLIGGFVARRHKEPDLAKAPLGLGSYAWGGERIRITRLTVPADLEDEPLMLTAGPDGAFELESPEGTTLVEGTAGAPAKSETTGAEIFLAELRARPGTRFSVVKIPRVEAIAEFQSQLSVREKGKQTAVIQLELDGADPERVVAVLDAVAKAYLRQNVERLSEEAEKTLAFITEQLPALRKSLEEAEWKLNEYRSRSGPVDLRLETEAMVNTSVEVEKQLTELALQGAELRRRFTDEHPLAIAMRRQRAQLEAQRRSIHEAMKKLPESELNFVRLTRDVQVANELYLLLLNKAQELKVVKSGTIGNVRIVDRAALVQQKPVHPRKILIAVLSLIGGLVLGTSVAFARKSLQRGVNDPDELERRAGLPVYASLPHSPNQAALAREYRRKKVSLSPLALMQPEDLAVEALRSLRSSLQFALPDARNNVVLIGGPRPGVGKSFVSVNLAVLLGDSGKRVLLVDGDLRKGLLHSYFGMERAPGLSEVLSGVLHIPDALRTTPHPKLSFLSAGAVPPNPSELLLNPRFERLVADASARFDLVLIDAPPLLAVTDAIIIGHLAGVNLLVLRAGVHPLREISLTVRRMQQNGLRPNGFIFNDVTRAGPYGHNKYGYHYLYEYRSDREHARTLHR